MDIDCDKMDALIKELVPKEYVCNYGPYEYGNGYEIEMSIYDKEDIDIEVGAIVAVDWNGNNHAEFIDGRVLGGNVVISSIDTDDITDIIKEMVRLIKEE